jgi:uncharacterized protein YecT (DUF1311 family)
MTLRAFPKRPLLMFGALAAASMAMAQMPASKAEDCESTATTQPQLNACAQQAFEAASAAYSASYRQLSQSVGNKQRQLLRQVQTEWMQFRTKACEFEQNGVAGGSAAPMVFWQCQTRMTRERTAELQRHLTCEEGDLSCVRPEK